MADTHTSISSSRPLDASQRVFGLRDHASLWFSLGVGLLVVLFLISKFVMTTH